MHEKAAADLKPGEVLLLENLRYHNEETKNNPEFAKQLASLADVAVDDAFGVSHRAHASNAGIAQYVEVVAGFLIEKEIQFIGTALSNPQRPFVAIIGGAKVSDKIGVISNLLEKADAVVIGGGMANTFLAAQGKGIGSSLFEEEKLPLAKELLAKAEEKGVKVFLPAEVVVADKFAADANHKTVSVDEVPADWMILDNKFSKECEDAVKNAKLYMIRQAGDTGQLYGSVSTRDIARMLKEIAGVNVESAQVLLGSPIKSIGAFDTKIALHPDVIVPVKVYVAQTQDEIEALVAGKVLTFGTKKVEESAEEATEAKAEEKTAEKAEEKAADAE